MNTIKPLSVISAIVVVVGLVVWWLSIWNECRTVHSFMYCLHVIGDRS